MALHLLSASVLGVCIKFFLIQLENTSSSLTSQASTASVNCREINDIDRNGCYSNRRKIKGLALKSGWWVGFFSFFFSCSFTQNSWHGKWQLALHQEPKHHFSKMYLLKHDTHNKISLTVLQYSRIKLWSLSCNQYYVLNWLLLFKEIKCKNLYCFPKVFLLH